MALRRGVKICYNSRDLVWLAELVGGRDVCSLVAYGNNVSVNNLLCPKKIKILPSDVGYDLAAGSYDEREKYLNSFEKDKLLPLLGKVDGLKILDAGAGTGRLAMKMAKMGASVVALDVSEKMLEVLRKKIKLKPSWAM